MGEPQNNDNEQGLADGSDSGAALIGSLFESRYQILSLLGAGSSGTAYRATDILLSRDVTLKILNESLISNDSAKERFAREAKTCTLLDHPGVAKTYASGSAADGRPFIVMDFFDGRTLEQVLREDGALSSDRFINLFAQVLDALEYAHAKNIVHRDLKPSNIMIVQDEDSKAERAVIIDFGIAKVIDPQNAQNTQTTAILGSSAYMSPEQCLGAKVDARSDIYSIACVMFESLSGAAPFQGDSSYDVMYKHLHESLGQLSLLKTMPKDLAVIIARCLQKRADDRFGSVSELKDAFRHCQMQSASGRIWKPDAAGSEQKRSVLPVALGVLALFVGGAFLLMGGLKLMDRKSSQSPEAGFVTRKPKELPPPETVQLHQSGSLLLGTLDKYNSMGARARQTILTRWIKRFGNRDDVDSAAKFFAYYQLAFYYSEESRFKEARAYLEKGMAVLPDNLSNIVDSTIMLCTIDLRELKVDQALDRIKQLEKEKREDLESRTNYEIYAKLLAKRAECLRVKGNLRECANNLQKAIEMTLEYYGRHHKNTGDYHARYLNVLIVLNDPALDTAIDQAVKLAEPGDGSSPAGEVYDLIGGSFEKAGKIAESRKYFRMSAEAFRKAGEPDRAAFMMNKAKGVVPGLPNAQTQMAALEKQIQNDANPTSRIMNYYELYKFSANNPQLEKRCVEGALAEIGKLKQSDSEALYKGYVVSCGLDLKVLSLNKEGRFLEAERFLKEWIAVYGKRNCQNLALLYSNLASVYHAQGKVDQALQAVAEALRLFSLPSVEEDCLASGFAASARRAGVLAKQYVIFVQNKRFEEAIESTKNAIKAQSEFAFDPSSLAALYCQLASALYQNKELSEAEKAYEKMRSYQRLLESAPTGKEAGELLSYAVFRAQEKQFAASDQLLSEGMAIIQKTFGADDFRLRPYWNTLAQNLREVGKSAQAESYLQKTVHVSEIKGLSDRPYFEALLGLAELKQSSSDFQSAKALLEKAKTVKLPVPVLQGFNKRLIALEHSLYR